ncbi:MAG: 30S ribosomal protein S9 [Candidatus Omnitrophica bacterium]|nr:30S ribosomal protein S9 [Candidatus Omnitrophota bacterium]
MTHTQQLSATGRRKEAVAQVRLKSGQGRIVVNGRSVEEYFPRPTLQMLIRQPFMMTQTLDKYDCVARVNGGGLSGQAGALQHGISRALSTIDQTLRATLRKGSFLTRDSRAKERKKYGRKGARKRFQWTKR